MLIFIVLLGYFVSFISSIDLIALFLSFDLQGWAVFILLDVIDPVIDLSPTVKILAPAIDGYWDYEYSDLVNDRGDSLGFDSYLIPTERNPADFPPNNPDLPRELTFTNLHEPGTREAARKALAGKAGIYCIRSLKDGKCYVGSAVNSYNRMSDHLWQNGSQSNTHLQAAIALYGLDNFEYFVISFVADNSVLVATEQKYIDMVPSNLRYNFCPTAGSSLGYKHTPEALAALSKARIGKGHSAETKAAISAALEGNKNALGNTGTSKSVFVYDQENVLVKEFPSHTAAAKFLGISKVHVGRLVRNGA